MPITTTRGVDTYVAVKAQTDLYTAADEATLTVGDYLPFDSEGMAGGRNIVNSPTLRRQAMKSSASSANGTQKAGGSLEFTASQFVLDKLLPLVTHVALDANGNPDLSTVEERATAAEKTAKISRKRFKLIPGGRLVPFTVFVGLTGAGGYTRKFKGCKINTFTISARVDEFIKISLDVQGLSKKIVDGTRVAVFPDQNLEYSYFFIGANAKIKAGNMTTLAELPVSSFEMQINHILNVDDYRLGSDERNTLDEGQTEVTGSFEMRAGSSSVSGSKLNITSQLTNDRAFLERLNEQSRYVTMELTLADRTRPLGLGATAAGTTTTVLKLTDAFVDVKAGDLIKVADVEVRVLSVDVAAKTITLTEPLGAVPGDATVISGYSMVRISLPAARLEEPQFSVSGPESIMGSTQFEAYNDLTIEHTAQLA